MSPIKLALTHAWRTLPCMNPSYKTGWFITTFDGYALSVRGQKYRSARPVKVSKRRRK